MNEELFAELVARYQSMDEWQIAELDAKKESLTEEARIALRGVVLDRKINPCLSGCHRHTLPVVC